MVVWPPALDAGEPRRCMVHQIKLAAARRRRPAAGIHRRNPSKRVGGGAAGVLPLWAESESRFFLKEVDAQLTFERDAAGSVTGVVLHQNGQNVPGKRLP